MTTYEEAIDSIFGAFRTVWNAGATAVCGYVPEVRYPGIELSTTPDRSKFWTRISQQTADEEQSSFRNATFGQTFENTGIVFVQVFCPASLAGSISKGRKLAELARNAYRGKSTQGGVWYRNAKITEMPAEQDWFVFRVSAEYIYNERT